jgi:CIC family chloride channel protein
MGKRNQIPLKTSERISLDDERNVLGVVQASVMNLWKTVNDLTRLQPTKRDRYRVTIFGSARVPKNHWAYQAVRDVAAELTRLDCDIVTGGGPGLMQAANEGVHVARPKAKSGSMGIRVDLPFEQNVNAFVTQAFDHGTFFTRLHHFVLVSDAFVVVPGGIGTLLETVMVWQLLQVRKLHDTPLILVGKMYGELVEWCKRYMLRDDCPLASPEAHLRGIADDEDRLPRKPTQWVVLMILAASVGTVTGAVGAVFRMALGEVGKARGEMIAHSQIHAIGWIIPAIICAAGAGIALYLTQRLAPLTAGSGIPRVEAVIRNHLKPAGAWTLPVKFVGGVLSIGSGLALGREGPTVQMGGTIGRVAGDTLKRWLPEPWTLIAAGAGAGLAVAFNAPLAASIFVVEELLERFSARVFSATLMACITGTVVSRAVLGNETDFSIPPLAQLTSDVLPGYLVLGLIAGFVGVAFNVSLLRTMKLIELTTRWPRGLKGAVVGAAAGLLAWFLPQLVGGGEPIAQTAITTHIPWLVLAGYLLVRFALTMISYGSGAPGGIFAPLLVIGALTGSGFAAAEGRLLHHANDPAPYAIVAMAACFTSIVRSPLTAVVLLLEMTGSWPLILPMMAASITAYAVPELLSVPPIYESLRRRDEEMERAARKRS